MVEISLTYYFLFLFVSLLLILQVLFKKLKELWNISEVYN